MMTMMMQIENDYDDAVLKAPHFTYTRLQYNTNVLHHGGRGPPITHTTTLFVEEIL